MQIVSILKQVCLRFTLTLRQAFNDVISKNMITMQLFEITMKLSKKVVFVNVYFCFTWNTVVFALKSLLHILCTFKNECYLTPKKLNFQK